jgi:hypothetical protein
MPATYPEWIHGERPHTHKEPKASHQRRVRAADAIRVHGASRDDVFKSFPAVGNLADKSDGGKINITIEGQSAAGYDPNWLRNAVQEPLDEANIDGMEMG